MFIEEFDHSGSENRENQEEKKSWREFYSHVFCPASASTVHFILFGNRQEKASGSLPTECSKGNSQDKGHEENRKPSGGGDGDHDNDDANTEDEDEFDSGDEEVLTKSGW